ncbi:MAG: pyrroline-5-carboxylate reductase [Bacteroides sp.]|nr:pyrroline-5-carboxylate reductase [Bacteroides sp.]MCM1413719.1 pyrroline-5-carboxylate reductase [Bacteroides sp.]MCM1471898.1 pyrroline-5-carboxylate reductase [Bacteroides sp.]
MNRIAIIGAGNMGGAIARAWAREFGGHNITVSNPSQGKLNKLRQEFDSLHTTSSNVEAATGASVVVIAVKPWKLAQVIDELKPCLEARLLISVVAGATPDDIAGMLEGCEKMPAIVYAIPNTAIATGKGVVFYTGRSVDESDGKDLEKLFAPLGKCFEVELCQMAAGMAVSSCGIAYAMRYIRAAMEGGVELGLTSALAQQAVMHTLEGAVALLEANGSHPEEEVDRVTTPGGITIRGLNAMEEAGFSASIIKGIRASKA